MAKEDHKQDGKQERLEKLVARLRRSADKPWAQRMNDLLSVVNKYKELGIDPIGEDSETRTHELYNFVPVLIYAHIEDYFRTSIAYLIDNQPECRPRARHLKDVKFSVDEVLAIGGSQLTAGQFIAHSIPLSDLGGIKRAMTTLLGNDFYHVLGRACTYNQREPGFAMHIGDFRPKVLQQAIETRHRICHEPGTETKITGKQCFDWLIEAAVLIGNTETILGCYLIGGEMQAEIFGKRT